MAHPLTNFSVMRTSDPEECLDVVSRHLGPHGFRTIIGHRSFKATLNNTRLRGSTITYLGYNAGTETKSAVIEDAYLVLIPLTGNIRCYYDRQEVTLSSRTGLAIQPDKPFTLQTGDASSGLMWRVPRAVLDRHVQEMIGKALNLAFEPVLDWRCGRTASLLRSVRFVANELDQIDGRTNACRYLKENFEQLLIRTLIEVQPNNVREHPAYQGNFIAPRCVRKVEDYIAAHLDEPLTVEDLVRVSGVSERSMYLSFKKFRGTSPMAYLRDLRLKTIREDLLQADPSLSVTEILSRRGVFQFGRFAASYKERYGETPSQTLRR